MPFFYIIASLFSVRVQRVVVDGVRSENLMVVFGVPQGSMFGSLPYFIVHE